MAKLRKENKTPEISSAWLREIARGNVDGSSLFYGHGSLIASGAVTAHMVWPLDGSGTLVIPDSAGVQVTITSSSENDTAAGTGLRTIRVNYLDGNLDQQTEDVTLDGTNDVLTDATDIRFINCVYQLTAGTGGAAAGNITFLNGSDNLSYILAGEKRCESSFRRIPRGKRLVIDGFYGGSASGSGNAKAAVRLVATAINGYDATETATTYHYAEGQFQNNTAPIPFNIPLTFGQGVVVGIETTTDKAADVSAGWYGFIEDL